MFYTGKYGFYIGHHELYMWILSFIPDAISPTEVSVSCIQASVMSIKEIMSFPRYTASFILDFFRFLLISMRSTPDKIKSIVDTMRCILNSI